MEENQETKTNKDKKKKLHPATICLIVTIIAIIGTILGFSNKSALIILIFLLPTVIYEVIRTQEGASTKASAILLLVLLIAELFLIIFKININLAQFLGEEEKYIAGYTVPLGDIKVFGPLLMTIFSVILIFRTYGPYTKWLSIVIASCSLVAILLINPTFFQQALKLIVNAFVDRIGYML